MDSTSHNNSTHLVNTLSQKINKHVIISDNIYLKLAFGNLLSENCWDTSFCVIDFDSCKSICNVLREVKGVDKKSRVIFIGNSNIYGFLLNGFLWFDNLYSVEMICNRMKRGGIKSLDMLETYLYSCIELSFMNLRSIHICTLCCYYDMPRVAQIMNLKINTLRNLLSSLKQKMNFKSTAHLFFYFINEFGHDGLKELYKSTFLSAGYTQSSQTIRIIN